MSADSMSIEVGRSSDRRAYRSACDEVGRDKAHKQLMKGAAWNARQRSQVHQLPVFLPRGDGVTSYLDEVIEGGRTLSCFPNAAWAAEPCSTHHRGAPDAAAASTPEPGVPQRSVRGQVTQRSAGRRQARSGADYRLGLPSSPNMFPIVALRS